VFPFQRRSVSARPHLHATERRTILDLWGAEELKRRWLAALARLQRIGTFSLTEPELTSGPGHHRAHAFV
jgi:alkylation response protein AidB-like acyl-CoA dehydrogenase